MLNKKKNKEISIANYAPLLILPSILTELVIQFLSLTIPGILIIKSYQSSNILFFILSLLISIYLYQIILLFLSAIAYRLTSKPKTGEILTTKEMVLYLYATSILIFVHRSLPRFTINMFPFPGYFFYRICGAKIAINVNILGIAHIFEPNLINIGRNTTLGNQALITPHIVKKFGKTLLGKIEIGNNVLVGAHSIIWPDVKIGDNSIVAENSSVKPGTIIPPNEIWGGNPAKFIKKLSK
ncbi:hypothetical protein J4408_02070 [Candidatus Pacearchaeota archaeon]|nr:hypothetical protein [Candidatus Pacearchaeota archaeon]